jgi:hypothetical protein
MCAVNGRQPVTNLKGGPKVKRIADCRLMVLLVAALVGIASAAYVIEWTAPLSYSSAYGYTSNQSYSYDITGDSIPELFVADSSSLKVFNGVTHSLIWTIPLSYTYGGYPLIANTDGDANKELAFSAYSYTSGYTGRFYVYDCVTHSLEYQSPVKSGYPSLAVADIDGDGKSELCLASGSGGSRILEVYGSDAQDVQEPPAPVTRDETPSPIPNPARLVVQLPIAPGAPGIVTVFDLSGRVVRTLAGAGFAAWDCRDDAGTPVSAGTYVFNSGSLTGRVEVVD